MRSLLFALLLGLCPLAQAMSSFSPDVSDLWWNPAESGWGVNLIQQNNIIFATFFVYGTDCRPRWYVSSDLTTNGSPEDMPMIWRGRLYETTGPVVGLGAFNPAAVTRRDVGEVTFLWSRGNTGTIEWSVDGVRASKQVQRQTWAATDITGEFYLNRVLRQHNCGGFNTGREPSINEAGTMTVSRSGNTVQIVTSSTPPSTQACTFTGALTQAGRMSAIEGTYSCNEGSSGPFTLQEIEVSQWGFMGRIFMNNFQGCFRHGHFGGTRLTVKERP